jgi:hypothetical protein
MKTASPFFALCLLCTATVVAEKAAFIKIDGTIGAGDDELHHGFERA